MLFPVHVKSQYYSTGTSPASIKWKQINTSNFQIIFPRGYEEKAKYMAAIFQDLLEKGGKDLQHTPKKFSVVLHTQNATANGMVAWAPKRMEIYTSSPQDQDGQLWLNHVGTHEYRHVVQIDKLEQGFTKVLNYIFGQQATVAVLGMYLPPWFLEGDAVCTETTLSESGRGRLPNFEQELRAQLLEKGSYSYDKAVNGSYKNYVTDRYKLGYYLVGKARVNYGDQLWGETLNRVGRRPYGITSFATGIKKGMQGKRDRLFEKLSERQKEILAQGIKVSKIDWQEVKEKNTKADGKISLYLDVMKEMQWEWQVQDTKLKKTEYSILSGREKIYTNKRFSQITENGDLIYHKEGLNNGGYFEIVRKNGKKEKLFTPGYNLETGFDYQKGKLIWAERKPNLRWEKANKSQVISYDIKNRSRIVWRSSKSRFAPAFSKNASKIVCVETDKLGHNSLLILDKNNKELKRIVAKENEYFITPQFGNQPNEIILLVLDSKGKHLVNIDLQTEKRNLLFSSGTNEMSQPEVTKDYIYFTGTFTGIENIYALQLSNGKIFQVTSSRFGARDPYFKKDKIYYSDYTSDGYLSVTTKADPSTFKEWNGKYAKYPLAMQLSEQVGGKMEVDSSKIDDFKVEDYSKLKNLFYFHSWAPVFIDGLESKADVGVSLATQNKLSTMLATFGYKRDDNYDKGKFYANLSYRGFFPIIDTKLTYGKREDTYNVFVKYANRLGMVIGQDKVLLKRKMDVINWETDIRFPLNLSSGQYTTFVIPKIGCEIVKYQNYKFQPLATTNPSGIVVNDFNSSDKVKSIAKLQLLAYNIAKQSPRDIQYRWAQLLNLNFRSTPSGDIKLGNIKSAELTLYTPGLLEHHGVKLYGGIQSRSSSNIYYSNIIQKVRGVRNLYGDLNYNLSFNYALPLTYPDWNIGPLAYFKRIKMNTFFDWGYVESKSSITKSKVKYDTFSTGVELRTDMHALRFMAPLDMGFRVGYENTTKDVFFDFLISISLTSF